MIASSNLLCLSYFAEMFGTLGFPLFRHHPWLAIRILAEAEWVKSAFLGWAEFHLYGVAATAVEALGADGFDWIGRFHGFFTFRFWSRIITRIFCERGRGYIKYRPNPAKRRMPYGSEDRTARGRGGIKYRLDSANVFLLPGSQDRTARIAFWLERSTSACVVSPP